MTETAEPEADALEVPPGEADKPVWWARHYTFFGTAVGLVFVWFSLTPSLLPRGPLFQGLVSGAAGAAIAVKLITDNPKFPEILVGILISASVAALTVALKSIGKNIAMKNNKEIVSTISLIFSFFMRDKK